MCNKGYTLVEILFVLSVFSFLLLLFPFVKPSLTLTTDTQRLLLRLEEAQLDAVLNQQRHVITIKPFELCFDEVCEVLPSARSVDEGKIVFNAAGNVNHAGTYCFHEGNQCKCIVIQLGSGRMSLE